MDETSATRSEREARDPWLAETWDAHRELARAALRCSLWTGRHWLWLGIPILILFGFFRVLGPVAPGNVYTTHGMWMGKVGELGYAMLVYAANNYNNGYAFPDGNSSTEVFQKLLDKGYVTDPRMFYVPMVGKIKPAPDQKRLKPENVCFDVTSGAEQGDSGSLPLVFLTGYRMNYAPGGAVVPIVKPYPPYLRDDSWFFYRDSDPLFVVYFKGNLTVVARPQAEVLEPSEGYPMEHLVPADFDAHGKTYRQLTPDGVLR